MNVPPFVKDNWPLLVGGAVGIYLIMRLRGGGGGGSNAPVIMNTGPSEGAVMAQAQLEGVRANIAAQERQDQRAYDLALATMGNAEKQAAQNFQLQSNALNAQVEASRAASQNAAVTAFAQYNVAQGETAKGIGTGVGSLLTALYAPSIAAMNATAAENAAAMQAGAIAAAGSYDAQAQMGRGITDMIGKFAEIPKTAAAGAGQAAAAPKEKTTAQTFMETMLKAYTGL